MQKIKSATDLRNTILQLESKRDRERVMLKAQFHLAYGSMKPINLLKSTFKGAATSLDLKDSILTTFAGLTAGYISKKIFVGVSNSPLKKLLGTILLFGITNVAAKNPETVKSLGNGFLKIIRSKLGNKVNGAGRSENNY